ncbi:MAG TPA: hypothetical protein DD000_18445, partial [Cyanobacteria bacterium UBA11166]|nr:hypothetical protein [Cyanobacteria bacterium UBA11166]
MKTVPFSPVCHQNQLVVGALALKRLLLTRLNPLGAVIVSGSLVSGYFAFPAQAQVRSNFFQEFNQQCQRATEASGRNLTQRSNYEFRQEESYGLPTEKQASFSGCDLRAANLSGANLSGV